jgi:ribose 5-phosphate isomerase B
MLAIGCDHRGVALKEALIARMNERNDSFIDYGTHTTEAVDYPVFAAKVAEAVSSGTCERGVLICGTGVGISIAANRHKGVRCALCNDIYTVESARLHNNANVLALGADIVGEGLAEALLDAFLDTPFSGDERHAKRVKMIELSNQ